MKFDAKKHIDKHIERIESALKNLKAIAVKVSLPTSSKKPVKKAKKAKK